MNNETKATYWENLNSKNASYVTLTDKESLQKSYQKNKDFEGLNVKVLSINTFYTNNNNFKIIRIKLEDNQEVFVRIFGKEKFDINLCDAINEEYFSPCTRGMAVTNEWLWLFQEPKDVNNFELTDLKYTTSLSYNVNEKDYVFNLSKIGLIPGYQNINNKKVNTVLCEYINEIQDKDVYEKIILLEEGYENKDGGIITLLKSKSISLEEIEIY
jgi:hypothetical protein